jgi:hypothetical protein
MVNLSLKYQFAICKFQYQNHINKVKIKNSIVSHL